MRGIGVYSRVTSAYKWLWPILFVALASTACTSVSTQQEKPVVPQEKPVMSQENDVVADEPPKWIGTATGPLYQPSPAVPAATLRAGVVRLLGSLKRSADINVSNAQKQMRAELVPDPREPLKWSARGGQVTEGWHYWYAVTKAGNSESFDMEFPAMSARVCTFDSGALATDLRALGYRRLEGSSSQAGAMGVSFARSSPRDDVTFEVDVTSYYTNAGDSCVKGIHIKEIGADTRK